MRKNKPLKLFSSVWAIPAWMRHTNGYTILKKPYYQVYANYYKKFYDEYAKHGVKFWGTTTQNEESGGYATPWIWATFWIPRDLVSYYCIVLCKRYQMSRKCNLLFKVLPIV